MYSGQEVETWVPEPGHFSTTGGDTLESVWESEGDRSGLGLGSATY